MSRESIFRSWSKPSSVTEKQKSDNAEKMIKNAISSDPILSNMDIQVFAQGSYRNNTNVRQNSDVDICVRLMSSFFYQLPDPPNNPNYFNINPSNYTYNDFKNNLENALINKFGKKGVTRGNKAFDIHENSYRVDADVVACFEHRRYILKPDGSYYYLSGIELCPDKGGSIINWPHQHYENGVNKNKNTGGRFKLITRVLKRLRYEMVDEGIKAAEVIPSFLIECLSWNAPNNSFGYDNYEDDVRDVLAHLFNNTMEDEQCQDWGEVSELKYLFSSAQPWTRKQAHNFLDAAWDYIGFE